MNTQFHVFHGGTFQLPVSVADAQGGELLRIAPCEAVRLDRLGGELTVLNGRVWLTRDGDLGDHFIEPGQKVRLGIDERAVVESARTGEPVALHWNPRRQSLAGALLAAPLRGLALLTGRLATGFAALARSAAASARRAQGCINGGDSIASCGALK